jgi:protein-tyrosine phosphatase
MKINAHSTITRGAAAVATISACAAGISMTGGPALAASQGPGAASAARAHHPHGWGAIPFTVATVAAGKAAGTLRVSWAAPRGEHVLVFAGKDATAQHTLVGRGQDHSSVVVTGADGEWIRLVPSRGKPLVLTVRDLGLSSDPNLRDVGGYRTGDGQWVRMGVVYRSQALALSPADLAVVDTLGITAVYDLRTPEETAATPDVVPAGATYTNLNVLGTSSVGIGTLTSPAQARRVMETMERTFVTSAPAHKAYGALLTGIASDHGAALYNCSAGKDRTGWATAVLLTLLGVPQRTVMQDYLLSNKYYFDSPAVQAMLAALPTAERAIYSQLLDVQPAYLRAGFEQVKASYGSMYDYVVKGLGVSPRTIARLRDRLLAG